MLISYNSIPTCALIGSLCQVEHDKEEFSDALGLLEGSTRSGNSVRVMVEQLDSFRGTGCPQAKLNRQPLRIRTILLTDRGTMSYISAMEAPPFRILQILPLYHSSRDGDCTRTTSDGAVPRNPPEIHHGLKAVLGERFLGVCAALARYKHPGCITV